ncbi:branched-chain amino acid ABC transporter substrate-binding protein [Amycolatopsis roodepoortensis]|uniref:branched-chain amino acid ABC transporter substrate-binding protein n=1 Tax=Amycolatopsis roodepoortensis TaxID=700274 RepID=UPI00214BB14A|nr:branched-chain amino acid ABC transporter substrate-binding protein [Amycolatopsis roodepoortensis]UUV31063.1 branched-chain amino acid ABC transporter substrate-binding protein [Amycolatopsis roodepoortensis]
MRFGRVFAVAAAASLALAGCAGGSSSSGSGDSSTLKIGFMGDLTGENSGIVIPPRNGAKLAIDEYNKTNPAIKLELKEYDSQGKPEQATSLIATAVGQDKITALIGPAFSGESKAIGGQLEQNKIPSVSPSATNAGLSSNGWKYWHRVVASDASQGPAIANFLVTAKSPKKAYIISDDQEYSVGLADNFEKTLKEKNVPSERDKFAKDASDYSSTVQKVKAANPDIILFGGYYAQGGRLLKQLRDGGVTATFATGDGSLDAQLISGAGAAAAEKAVVGCPCNIPDAGSTDEFSTKYKAAFNVDPAIYSSEGYDAATAIINAVKSGANTSEKINEALKTIDFKGASKQIKFKENGEPSTEAINIYQVTGGVLKNLGVSTEAKLNG